MYQSDIVAILNTSGTAVVRYTYDAWGKLLTTTGSMTSTLGVHNPLRYRGYVYDNETQLYYLQSRYYNPAMGRFINADGFASTGQGILGNNMFAYCLNSPTQYEDSYGTTAIGVIPIIGPGVGAGLIGGAFAFIQEFCNAVYEELRTAVDTLELLFFDKTPENKRNHILNGSEGKSSEIHRNGWKQLAADPNDPNDKKWKIVLPFIEQAVLNGERQYRIFSQKNAGYRERFTYYMAEYGVEIIVDVFEFLETGKRQLADAWAKIIGG